jgi:hypothetical protein
MSSLAIQSASRKFSRALDHRKLIERCVAEYTRRKPYKVVRDANGEKTLRIIRQPPSDVSLFAGEMLYQLRSALDHLFFELVERNYGKPVPKEIARECQFPLLDTRPTGHSSPVPKHVLFSKQKLFQWIPDKAYTFVESLQPYNTGYPATQLLGMLGKLSNIDKHRRLNATVTIVDSRHIFTHPAFSSVFIRPSLQDGAKLPRPVPPTVPHIKDKRAMKMKIEYRPVIAFDEPEAGKPETALLEDVTHGLPALVFQITLVFKQFLK